MADKNKNSGIQDEAENKILELQDEEGNVYKFEMLAVIEYEGADYALFLPVDSQGANAELVHIFLIEENLDSDEDNYVGIEDEGVINAVYNIFMEKYKEEYNFID